MRSSSPAFGSPTRDLGQRAGIGALGFYEQGEGHLSRAEADSFDGLFFDLTMTAEVFAAGIDTDRRPVLRESLKPVGV